MGIVVLIIYILSLLFIFLFSLGQLHLVWHYNHRNKKHAGSRTPEAYPMVTVQLPVYNEKYVAERLVDNICALRYPNLEIQVLDDSTDETTEILKKSIDKWCAAGVDIQLVRRADRKGFKAGALQYGLSSAKGEFIAIFDADFLPPSDFLLKILPEFEEDTGVVQARWGHLNRDYSLLTRLQAFGLDAHFTVEQSGRSAAGSFINFNGTAGVWRKSCILDAGGWSDDTLTEDLDLSYRAQLRGWKFKFMEDTEVPAELPVIMPAIKSQQFRWNKGAAETARKNLAKVLRARIGFSSKVHAFFHLLNSAVFVALLIAAILSVPVLYIKQSHPEWEPLFYTGAVFLIGFLSIAWFYWTSIKSLNPEKAPKQFFTYFPLFLVVSMGLSLHNGLAVIEGLIGKKSPFLRTPKFNLSQTGRSWKSNSYISFSFSAKTLLEALLAIYFAGGVIYGIHVGDTGLLLFHLMLCIGFGFVFYQSILPLHGRRRLQGK